MTDITRRGLVGTCAAAAALPAFATAARAAPEMGKATIGFVPASDFVGVMIAKDRGIFAKDGLDAKLIITPLISNIPAGLLSGSMQIGATTAPIFLQAVENGLDLVAIAGDVRWTPDSQPASLMAAKGENIRTAADLKGKRVAVPGFNSLFDLVFRRWLELNHVPVKSVTRVEASFPSMVDLLRSRQVDAALVIEPFRTAVIKSGAGTRIADIAKEVNPDIMAAFWISTRAWADANKPLVAAFRSGLRAGMKEFVDDPSSRAIGLKYLRVMAPDIPVFAPRITAADLVFPEQLSRHFGLLTKPMDLKKLIFP